MLFGLADDVQVSWQDTVKVLGGAALALIPQLWMYLQKKREVEPAIDAKRQRVRSKDRTLEQDMQDHLFGKYQTMLDGFEVKLDKLEKDHLTCQMENSKLNERCDNQSRRIVELTDEVERLGLRIKELEAQAGGV